MPSDFGVSKPLFTSSLIKCFIVLAFIIPVTNHNNMLEDGRFLIKQET